MTDIQHILDRSCTRVHIDAHSRKRLLEVASDLIAESHPDLSARSLLDGLLSRERLGSTGLGEGVAIPHCRIPCDHMLGACLTLGEAVDYDAMDGQPVDLLFVIVVPPEETDAHLELLADLARLFSDPGNRETLRATGTDAELYERVVGLFSSRAA